MITVTMNTARLKLTVEGHAQPEESKEYREICAAVSAISQGLVWCVSKYNDGEGAMKSIEYRPDPGNLLLKVYPEAWAERAIRWRFMNYGDAFELLAKSHHKSVIFILDGERMIPEEGAQ